MKYTYDTDDIKSEEVKKDIERCIEKNGFKDVVENGWALLESSTQVKTLDDAVLRLCELIGCENCPIKIFGLDQRSRYEHEYLQVMCCENLWRWITNESKRFLIDQKEVIDNGAIVNMNNWSQIDEDTLRFKDRSLRDIGMYEMKVDKDEKNLDYDSIVSFYFVSNDGNKRLISLNKTLQEGMEKARTDYLELTKEKDDEQRTDDGIHE